MGTVPPTDSSRPQAGPPSVAPAAGLPVSTPGTPPSTLATNVSTSPSFPGDFLCVQKGGETTPRQEKDNARRTGGGPGSGGGGGGQLAGLGSGHQQAEHCGGLHGVGAGCGSKKVAVGVGEMDGAKRVPDLDVWETTHSSKKKTFYPLADFGGPNKCIENRAGG